jgi:hypothetical protein
MFSRVDQGSTAGISAEKSQKIQYEKSRPGITLFTLGMFIVLHTFRQDGPISIIAAGFQEQNSVAADFSD